MRRRGRNVRDRYLGRLDGLVNNAGISPVLQRAEEISTEQWRAICDVNLTGAFIASSRAGRVMLEQGFGSIVNVSSVHGHVAGERLAAYSASKGGLNMLTRSLAVEWADRGVRVNSVAPSYVETSMTSGLLASDRWPARLLAKVPIGRFAQAEEMSGAVHFLLSPASGYITGTIMDVDGGWSAQYGHPRHRVVDVIPRRRSQSAQTNRTGSRLGPVTPAAGRQTASPAPSRRDTRPARADRASVSSSRESIAPRQ